MVGDFASVFHGAGLNGIELSSKEDQIRNLALDLSGEVDFDEFVDAPVDLQGLWNIVLDDDVFDLQHFQVVDIGKGGTKNFPHFMYFVVDFI